MRPSFLIKAKFVIHRVGGGFAYLVTSVINAFKPFLIMLVALKSILENLRDIIWVQFLQ